MPEHVRTAPNPRSPGRLRWIVTLLDSLRFEAARASQTTRCTWRKRAARDAWHAAPMASSSTGSPVVALALACHPVPTVAVTAMGTVLVVSAGNDVATVVVAAVAVLTGQLSIGWSNDLVDVRRDAASGRRDKPLATGAVTPRVVAAATAVATTVTVVSSLASAGGPGWPSCASWRAAGSTTTRSSRRRCPRCPSSSRSAPCRRSRPSH